MDYSIFDSLLDSVFIVDSDMKIVYVNEAGATLAESSIRRLTDKKTINDLFKFDESKLFITGGDWGKNEATPGLEVKFTLTSGEEGRVRLAIQPFEGQNNQKLWAVMMRDVTLEETLHNKYHAQLSAKEEVIEQLKDAQKKLEAYSKNLEEMVEDRTKELKKANHMLSAIMDSLGQGFLVFNQEGVCSDIYTKACETVLETKPGGKNIWDVFNLNDKDEDTFKKWMMAVFSNALPFDDLKNLAPETYNHSEHKYVTLDYYNLEAEDENNIVVVATDRTAEREAEIALENEKQYAKMIIKLVTGKKQFSQFLDRSSEMILRIKKALEESKGKKIDHDYLFRMIHTFEGEVATYSVSQLWTAARVAQEYLEPIRFGIVDDYDATVDKFSKSIDSLQETYENFVEENSKLFFIVGINRDHSIEVSEEEVYQILEELYEKGLSKELCQEIQDRLLKEPIGEYFSHFDGAVQSVAERLKKKVEPIVFTGMETKVYYSFYKELFASLIHAFRNATDHGIEMPEKRISTGKPEEGHIYVGVLEFTRDGDNWLRITIEDDGSGIDPEIIKSKLPEAKIKGLSSHEILQIIFDDGFSSKDVVSDFSGRGVGMSAIKHEAERLGGIVWMSSTLKKGSLLTVEVPNISKPLNFDQDRVLAS